MKIYVRYVVRKQLWKTIIVHHGYSNSRQSRKGFMCWRVDSSANHSLVSVWSSTVTNRSKPKTPAFLEIITYFNVHFLSFCSLLLVNNFNTIHDFKHDCTIWVCIPYLVTILKAISVQQYYKTYFQGVNSFAVSFFVVCVVYLLL